MSLTVNATRDFTCDTCGAEDTGNAKTVERPDGWEEFDCRTTGEKLHICATCKGKSTDADKATVYDALFGA